MDKKSDVISVGVYIYGDNLDPEYLSNVIGIEPTKKQRKGDANKKSVARHGYWIKEFFFAGRDVESHLNALSVELEKIKCNDILKIENVDSAHLDIYLGTHLENSAARSNFTINKDILYVLAKINLPLMITFCADEVI